MKFGIFDSVDRCWLGNDAGPLLYGTKLEAKYAANILMYRMRNWRYRARRFTAKKVHYKDEIQPPVSLAEAIHKVNQNTGWKVIDP